MHVKFERVAGVALIGLGVLGWLELRRLREEVVASRPARIDPAELGLTPAVSLDSLDPQPRAIETAAHHPWLEVRRTSEGVVERSGDRAGLHGLGWMVLHEGKQVLHRNAEGETQYDMSRAREGTYTVYLVAFIDGAYRPVSNVITWQQ